VVQDGISAEELSQRREDHIGHHLHLARRKGCNGSEVRDRVVRGKGQGMRREGEGAGEW